MRTVMRPGDVERNVLIGMIVHPQVIGRIAPKWTDEGLFDTSLANTVGGWCVHFYRKHETAPGKAIESMFRRWADHAPKDLAKSIEAMLTGLARKYDRLKKELNPNYLIDMAGDLFDAVRLKKLVAAVEGDLEVGKLSEAVKRVNKHRSVEIGIGAGVDPFNDPNAVSEATQEDANSVLIRYSGALGNFFGDALERDGFVAFMGPEKRGKSWVLMDLAYRAMLQRRRVAVFEVGDLTKKQFLRRLYTRAVGRPLKPTRQPFKYPTKLVVHTKVDEANKFTDKEVEFDHVPRSYTDYVSDQEIKKALDKIRNEKIRSEESYFKLSVHPNSSLTVSGIRTVLKEWEVQGWIPDVVVIDYADILAPPVGFHGESRDAINENWKAMRRMSQELHCLVVTATQANAASYTSSSLGMQNFSEDKRKFSHVTGIVGLNQTDPEKVSGVQRWNWLVLREDDFLTSNHVYVAQCLAIANPCVRSAS